ncbi:MAG: DUF1573 domain-containing protein, partial [Planctomycetota bacterium]
MNPHQRSNQRLQVVVAALILTGAGCDQAGQPAAQPPPSQQTPTAQAPAQPPPAQQTPTAQAAAKPASPPSTAPSVDGPHMTFKTTWIDLGQFSEAESRSVTFEFTNTGNDVLHIRDIKNSCYCTVATVPKMAYQPGEGGTVDVEFEPPRGGYQDRSVTLLTNAHPQETISLSITADVQPFVTFQPSSLVLGVLRLGEEHRATFSVSCADESFEIESIVSTNSYATMELIEDASGSAAAAKTFELTITPDAPWG